MTSMQRSMLSQSRLPSWGKLNRRRYQAILEVGGGSFLDVGCSSGEYVQNLSKPSGHPAFGVDLLQDRAWQAIPGKPFVCASAENLPFPSQSFDTLLAFEILEHTSNPQAVLQEFHRVCRSNLVLSVPNCEPQPDVLSAGLAFSHWTDRTHCNFFTRPALHEILQASGFEVTSIVLINRAFLDYPALRSFHLPHKLAYLLSRLLARVPFRRQYFITILASAKRRDR